MREEPQVGVGHDHVVLFARGGHFGVAQAAAKQKAKAVATFKAVARESAGGVSTLARLWQIHLGQGRG